MGSHRIIRRGISFDLMPVAENGPGVVSRPYDIPIWSGETPPGQAEWDAAREEVTAEPIIETHMAVVGRELVEQEWRPLRLLGKLTMPFGIGTWKDVAPIQQEKAPEAGSAVPTF